MIDTFRAFTTAAFLLGRGVDRILLTETLADLEWRGARRDDLLALLDEIGDRGFAARVGQWRDDG